MITKKQLEEYQIAYSKGQPLISDFEYDNLLEEYLSKHGESKRPFLRNKQSTAINDIVGTLSKVYGVTEPFREGQKCYKNWNRYRIFHIIAQPKFDGCSIAYDSEKNTWFTRGDYDNGESIDITDLFKDREIKDIWKYEYGCRSVKFEAIMSREAFDELKPCGKNGERYVDPRSAVSGIISSRNIDLVKYIDLIELRRISTEGNHFISDMLMRFNDPCDSNNYDVIQSYIDSLLEKGATVSFLFPDKNTSTSYDVDGVVISELIRDHHRISIINPDNEIAIKILNDVKETIIHDIEYQFGLSGRITPVAKVQPVEFDGRVITSIGLSTLDRVASLAMKHGDTVKVTYNIVPYLLSSNHDGTHPIPIPTQCPHCGQAFDMSTLKQVKCRNVECLGTRLGAVIRYCKKMKMMGVERGIITKLWEANIVTSISSLYELTIDKICSVQGFKETSAKNMIKSIEKGSKDVNLYKWLGAWPMEDVSSKTWRSFIEQSEKNQYENEFIFGEEFIAAFGNSELLNQFITWMFNNSGICYHGFREVTINKMCKGIKHNADEMVKVFPYITFNDLKETVGKVCLSGTRNKNLIEHLQKQGWEVTDTLTKECKVLLTTDVNSSKAKKALKNNIIVVPIDKSVDFEKIELGPF